MSTRKGLYDVYCVLASVTSVLRGSNSIAQESFKQWFNTSILIKPTLDQYQWYNDPKWEEAKELSSQVKRSTRNNIDRKSTGNSNRGVKENLRHYSTSRKVEDVC